MLFTGDLVDTAPVAGNGDQLKRWPKRSPPRLLKGFAGGQPLLTGMVIEHQQDTDGLSATAADR